MTPPGPIRLSLLSLSLALFPAMPNDAHGAGDGARVNNPSAPPAVSKTLVDVLPPGKWPQVEGSVDRGLTWLASQQAQNGSFPTLPAGQPAVTSLCVLAFLSRGHQPGLGPYGPLMNRAIDYVISCQTPDGLFSIETPGPEHVDRAPSHTAVYNHAISGLMLGEVYGATSGARMQNVKQAILKALKFTRDLQTRPKDFEADKGGWRYLRLRFDHAAADSDLSVTSWQLMFLRSARNAEFDVPQKYIDEAMEFVHRCWDEKRGVFDYALEGGADIRSSRGMMGAGILSLSLAGQHQTPVALAAGDWLLDHPYRHFGELIGPDDNFYYSTYYCSQAGAQLGGKYWRGIFSPLVDSLLGAQSAEGSWPPEPCGPGIARFGNAYSTAMAILSLTPPYQLLPVYQR